MFCVYVSLSYLYCTCIIVLYVRIGNLILLKRGGETHTPPFFSLLNSYVHIVRDEKVQIGDLIYGSICVVHKDPYACLAFQEFFFSVDIKKRKYRCY